MFKTFRYFFLGFQFVVLMGWCTEYQPWLGNIYEFEERATLRYQRYSKLASGRHFKKYSSNDVFLNFSLLNTLPDPLVSGEIEFSQAKTRKQRGQLDFIKATGRYLLQDDVAGDPISAVLGLSYIQAFSNSLKDVSSFHHGLYNSELFVSIGKEHSQDANWDSRWWLMGALGIAEKGSPWCRLHLNYEKRLREKHELKAFLNTLWGFGQRRLRFDHFEGYGPVKHQSIDLGLKYAYLIQYFGHVSLEYTYRVYARNFPCHTHQVLAQVLYTFGL